MPEGLARVIALLLEAAIWTVIGFAFTMIVFFDGYWSDKDWVLYVFIPLGFGILGPPLWRRYGQPRWYKGP